MASEQFSLCWDNFHKNMSSGMNSLLENEDLVDVTLAVEGKCLKAHKMVLSVCSPYFKELFKSNPCQHPIVFMKDVSYVALSDLLQFMYQGEVQVSQENLTTFIKTAEALQIKGLTGDGNGSTDADESVSEDKTVHHQIEEYKPTPRPKKQPAPSPVVTTTPAPKRQRLSVSSESSQPLPPVITKPEPVSTPAASTTEPIQFKMEPYDQSHTLGMHDDNPDDTFGDDTLDDTNVDDTEDYSMMEGGEEEPQAGTSTDGAGEGQGFPKKPKGKGVVYVNGYSYALSYKRGNKTYLACSCRRSFRCRSRAVIPENGTLKDIIINAEHSHPPDYTLELRRKIWKTLKEFSLTLPGTTQQIYESVVSIYPETEHLYPYHSVESSLKRFRRQIKDFLFK